MSFVLFERRPFPVCFISIKRLALDRLMNRFLFTAKSSLVSPPKFRNTAVVCFICLAKDYRRGWSLNPWGIRISVCVFAIAKVNTKRQGIQR